MPQTNTDKGALHFEVLDATPPWLDTPETILFHHGVAITSGIWAGWPPALSDRYRILTFDVRGYGRSNIPDKSFDWSFELLAEDVLAVADAAGVDKFHFVGESMGGAMGLYLSIHHPDRLLSVTPCTSPHNGGAVRWLVEWRDYISEHGMDGWSERMMGRRFYPGGLSQAAQSWFASTQVSSAPQSVLGHGEMLLEVNLSPQLSSITIPVHLIAADNSPFLPLTITLEILQAIPSAEMDVIPNSRHGVVFSHAEQCAQSLRGFLDRTGVGSKIA